jgi:hypothetical protein
MNFLKCKAHYSCLLSSFVVIVLLGALLLVACDSKTDTGAIDGSAAADSAGAAGSEAATAESPTSLQELAQQIAGEYGKVESVLENDSDITVFVFPENHASMLQRLEMAIMLNRLYATQDVLHLGLEGWPADDPPMELSWAHAPPPYVPGEPITRREDVLAHMLKEGEFTSIEFMGLIYDDVVVHGIDDAELRAKTIDYSVRFVPLDYLYAIALATMGDGDLDFWSGLVEDEEFERAFEFAILSTDYTSEAMDRYEDLESVEEQQALLDEIVDKVEEVSAELRPAEVENMRALLDYMDIVDERSDVFAESILDIAEENPGAPVAIEIGFSHTQRVVGLLEEAGVSYATIYPISYYLEEDPSLLSLEAYERQEAGLSPGGPGSIGRWLTGNIGVLKGHLQTTAFQFGIRELTVSFYDFFVESEREGEREEGSEGYPPDVMEEINRAFAEARASRQSPSERILADVNSGWEFQCEGAWYLDGYPHLQMGYSSAFVLPAQIEVSRDPSAGGFIGSSSEGSISSGGLATGSLADSLESMHIELVASYSLSPAQSQDISRGEGSYVAGTGVRYNIQTSQ